MILKLGPLIEHYITLQHYRIKYLRKKYAENVHLTSPRHDNLKQKGQGAIYKSHFGL